MAPGLRDRPASCRPSGGLLAWARLGPMGEEAERWVGPPFPVGQATPTNLLASQREVVAGCIAGGP